MSNLISGNIEWSHHRPVRQAFLIISPNDSKLLIYRGGIISLSVLCFRVSADALKIKQNTSPTSLIIRLELKDFNFSHPGPCPW